MDDNVQLNTDKMAHIARYLSYGWALVPLHHIRPDGRCSCGTDCGKSAGKHPISARWQLDVHRDATAWAGIAFACNVGIATGAPSNHWVLDHDPEGARKAGTVELCDDILRRLALAPHVRTGGGGDHWRFAMPDDFEPTNRRGTLPVGLDVRGTGGQVVAPPSVSGKGPYVELSDAPPYAAPGWLLDMIRPATPLPRLPPAGWSPLHVPGTAQLPGSDDRGQRYAVGAVRELLAELAGAPEGTRNDTAFRVAARLHELINAGWVPPGVVADYMAAGEHANVDGQFGPIEVDRCWNGGARKVGDRPAELPPEWTDPLRVEVWPAPPTSPAGVPPFSPSSNGAASTSVVHAPLPDGAIRFTEPGTTPGGSGAPPNGAPPSATYSATPEFSAVSTPTDLHFDPQTEVEITRAMRLLVAREQAPERLKRMRAGERVARLDVLRSRLLTGEQLDAVPSLVPLVDDMLYRDSLARINGLPGQGKSFLALDVGACVATGRPWHGREVLRAPVVYMVAEGLSGVRARKRAWESRNGPVGDGLRFYAGAEQVAGEDWEIFTALCVEVGAGLVVIDTQARATAGRNENLPADMGPVVAGLDALRVATGGCVLLVHHKSKTGEGGRGTNAVEGAMQSEFDVAKNGPTVTLRTTRQKDTDATLRLALTLTPAGDSAVLVLPGESGEKLSAIDTGRMRQRALWNFMFAFCNEGDGLSKAKIEAGMKIDPAFSTESKYYASAFQRAWNGLIKLGLVTKHFRRDVFKVIVLEDQGDDGVLTPNGSKDGLDRWSPSGDWILWTADQDSVFKAKDDAV